MKSFYHLEYSYYCLYIYCYTHNVSVEAHFGLLQVIHVIENPHRTEPFNISWSIVLIQLTMTGYKC